MILNKKGGCNNVSRVSMVLVGGNSSRSCRIVLLVLREIRSDVMGILNWLLGGGIIFILITWWIDLFQYI